MGSERHLGEDSRTEWHSIRRQAAEVFDAVAGAADEVLPNHLRDGPNPDEGQLVLCGEAIEVRRGRGKWFLTLRDSEVDDLTIEASLPRTQARPRPGQTLKLVGGYRLVRSENNVTVRLEFVGHSYAEPPFRSKRSRSRRQRLDEVRRNHTALKSLSGGLRRIAVVTSATSRARDDFEKQLGAAARYLEVQHIDVPLEGASPEEIAGGIRAAGDTGADLIVLTRGGGEVAKLERLSHPSVVEAVAAVAAKVPVLVAVGHARDHVFAEDVASLVEPTPSAAGQKVARLYWLQQRAERPLRADERRSPGTRGLRLLVRLFVVATLVLLGWFLRGLLPVSGEMAVNPGAGLVDEGGKGRQKAASVAPQRPTGKKTRVSKPAQDLHQH